MDDIIQYITGGQTVFTPSVVVGMIVFCMIFDSLCMLMGNMVKVGKR